MSVFQELEEEASFFAVVVTGKASHRGRQVWGLLDSLATLTKSVSGMQIIYSTSDDFGRRTAIPASVRVVQTKSKIVGHRNSCSAGIQSSQFESAYGLIPDETRIVARVRSDFVLEDREAFVSKMMWASKHLKRGQVILSAEGTRNPILAPTPFYFGDLFQIGHKEDLWAYFNGVDGCCSLDDSTLSWWSRALDFQRKGVKPPEQCFGKNFLSNIGAIHDPNAKNESFTSFLSSSNSIWRNFIPMSHKEMGLSTSFSYNRRMKIFFWGALPLGIHRQRISQKSAILISVWGWVVSKCLFFLHPYWFSPRVRFIIKRLKLRSGAWRQ